jgi:hypothetical protein
MTQRSHGVRDQKYFSATENSEILDSHREMPVCAEQPRATWLLPPQDGRLMSQTDEFKIQGGRR